MGSLFRAAQTVIGFVMTIPALTLALISTILVAVAVAGMCLQRASHRRGFGAAQSGPTILAPNGPTAPGPVSIRGLGLKMQLVYERGFRRYPRPVTVYGASGRRGADGRVRLERLHAICHVKRAPRTFRIDRIVTAADARSVIIRDLNAWVLAAADAR